VSLSPTQLSLRYLRKQGYRAEVVEHWNAYAHVRQDLFGAFDILALGKFAQKWSVIAIQTTGATNLSTRREKLSHEASEAVSECILSGVVCLIHGWKKLGRIWTLKCEQLFLERNGLIYSRILEERSSNDGNEKRQAQEGQQEKESH
jgi:hypothetical protein